MVNVLDIEGERNILSRLTDDVRVEIETEIKDGYNRDRRARQDWERRTRQAHELAAQVMEEKQEPWPKAANVKFPLLTIATLQFASRALPSLIARPMPVKCGVTGYDPDGEKYKRSDRVSKHMSWQCMEVIPEWEASMDRLLHVVPIVGCAIRKTWYDDIDGYPCVELVLPEDFVVPWRTKSIAKAIRVTERLWKPYNEIVEKQNAGLWDDIEIDEENHGGLDWVPDGDPVGVDRDADHLILEQHLWWDLDQDGYKEPYIAWLHYATGKMLRLAPRFRDIKMRDNRIVKIVPEQFYTKYGFVPSPRGEFYDWGFGQLLMPINETVNTTINQLIDAGSLSNQQAGFIGRGARMRGGNVRFKPGEWKLVNATGDALKNNIVPLPVRDPSSVLFNLLSLMIQYGERIAAITDIMVGESPGQHTTAFTTQQMIEQGQKVFQGIFGRLHRALGEELRLLYQINARTVTENDYYRVLDYKPDQEAMKLAVQALAMEIAEQLMAQGVPEQQAQMQAIVQVQEAGPDAILNKARGDQWQRVLKDDYQDDRVRGNADVHPASDPAMASEQKKQMQAAVILDSMARGAPVDPFLAWNMVYEAADIPNREKLLVPPSNEPPIEVQLQMAESKRKDMDVEVRAQTSIMDSQVNANKAEAEILKLMAEVQDTKLMGKLEEKRVAIENERVAIEGLKVVVERERLESEKEQADEEGELRRMEIKQRNKGGADRAKSAA